MQGSWPSVRDDPDLQPYMRRQEELSVEEGCILWGSRVIIPPRGRQTMIEELHEAHPGASRMKSFISELREVAKHGHRFGVCCVEMSCVPVQSSGPSSSGITSLGGAEPTVDESACGLLRTCNGKDDSGGGECPFCGLRPT